MLKIGTSDLRILKLIIQDNEVLYSRYVMKMVKRATQRNEDVIHMFEAAEGGLKGVLLRDVYPATIQECMEVFVRHEEFELANEAKQVADLVDIYMLLTEHIATPPLP